jgi:hypothetical protein
MALHQHGDRMMLSSKVMVISLGLLAAVLAGCDGGRTAIPSGAQEVHVFVTGSEVRLDPVTAHAGDIYVVVDTPGSSVTFIQQMATAEATPGPLSNDDLARLARGDTQGMSITCCFGNGETHGNVHKVVLGAGKYLLITDDPTALADRSGGVVPPGSMAVLEVGP